MNAAPAVVAPAVASGRGPLLLLLALFVAPLAAAWLVLQLGWYQPAVTNKGELLAPGLTLASQGAGSASGQWLLLIRLEQDCDPRCTTQLELLGNGWQTLGREQGRVAIRLLGLSPWQPEGASRLPLQPQAVATEAIGWFDNSLVIADPMGNLVLRYPLDDGLQPALRLALQDLRKLLKQSKIG